MHGLRDSAAFSTDVDTSDSEVKIQKIRCKSQELRLKSNVPV